MDIDHGPAGGSFAARIALPSALAIILFVAATFLYIIPSFERNMMDRKRETITELTKSAHSLLARFHAEEKAGRLTAAQAKKQAADAVRALRYGPEEKDYFWITDLGPRMIVHPYRPDLDGKDLSDFRDSHGKLMFVEFAEVCRREGAGYVDYMWQWKDEADRIVPKLSYVKLFEPWGWVIGTGIYIEDVLEEIKRLEADLIKISLLMAFIIAGILVYVNHQSLRVERSRREAEKRLAESEEKYRKLVEAATEGIIMVLDGRPAYSNRMVLDMLGYSAEELERLDLSDLLHPESSATVEYLAELLETGDAPPQMEARLRRRDGETLRALLTASGLVFGGRKGFILTVKDIDSHKRTEEELSASRERFRLLTDSIDLGVLRADLAAGKVTEANPAACRILGYAAPEGLAAAGRSPLAPFEELFEEASAGRTINEARVSLLSDTGPRALLVSITGLPGEGAQARVFDCLLEDVTVRERAEAEREKLLSDLQLSLGSLNQSARGVARPAPRCGLSASVGKAAEIMTAAGSSSVLVESEGEVIGILTDHDLRARVLASRSARNNEPRNSGTAATGVGGYADDPAPQVPGAVSPGPGPGTDSGKCRPDPAGGVGAELPVSRVMSSPLVSVPETALLFEAVLLMQEKNIRHLAVRDAAGRVTGVIDEKELLALKWYSPASLMEEFSRAADVDAVIAVKGRLPRLVRTLSDTGADSAGITRLITAAADAATARFVEFAVNELGEPPVPFAFMALGSQARREQTLVTDQDNAIVYEYPPGDMPRGVPSEAACAEYFQALGTKVCAWLDAAGYPFCKGGAMASNPKWCRPLRDWKAYFTGWAALTEAQALLDVNVFFDFRRAWGEESLEKELRAHVRAAVKDRTILFLNLANNALQFRVPLGFRGALELEGEGEHKGTFDAKKLLRVFTDFARVYALRADIQALPTPARLAALTEANVLDRAEKESFAQAVDALTRLRLKRQAARAAAGGAPDNRIRPSELSQADQQALRETAAAAAAAVNKLKDLIKFNIV
ncbi:MAG: PAS sensor protein [Elusimicrobia bacterium]|nr:MAG: PAS sensor protein [Elusimicrobiota bacterium]KAF0153854.1 MAG: PAS sensor protein [Elusimicrobiota bacterium]